MANPADLFNGKQLYIAHLAARLEAMERTPRKLNAFSYRLWSRRLREAMAGCPEPLLARGLRSRTRASRRPSSSGSSIPTARCRDPQANRPARRPIG